MRKIFTKLRENIGFAASKTWRKCRRTGDWLRNHGKKIIICLVIVCISVAVTDFGALRNEFHYQKGVRLYEEKSYEAAADHFHKTVDYKDAEDYASLCWDYLIYEQATDFMHGKAYEAAQNLFASLGTFEDAEEMAILCEKYACYQQATIWMNSGAYADARALFVSLETFEDAEAMAAHCSEKIQEAQYNIAQQLLYEGRLSEAYAAFSETDNYKDTRKKMEQIRSHFNAAGYFESDAVYLEYASCFWLSHCYDEDIMIYDRKFDYYGEAPPADIWETYPNFKIEIYVKRYDTAFFEPDNFKKESGAVDGYDYFSYTGKIEDTNQLYKIAMIHDPSTKTTVYLVIYKFKNTLSDREVIAELDAITNSVRIKC